MTGSLSSTFVGADHAERVTEPAGPIRTSTCRWKHCGSTRLRTLLGRHLTRAIWAAALTGAPPPRGGSAPGIVGEQP